MKNKKHIITFIIGLVSLYLLYLIGNTLYENYQVKKEVKDLEMAIIELEENNRVLTEEISYYKTASYVEKIARERLGLMKEGEKVIVIVPEAQSTVVDSGGEVNNLPNYLKWWNYFFGV